jgi:hypothetical protein
MPHLQKLAIPRVWPFDKGQHVLQGHVVPIMPVGFGKAGPVSVLLLLKALRRLSPQVCTQPVFALPNQAQSFG